HCVNTRVTSAFFPLSLPDALPICIIYSMGDIPEDTREGQDTIQIDEAFDKFTPLVLLVPKGDIAREDKLASELDTLPNIKSIVSYTDAVGSGIPPEFLAESEREEFF